MTVNSSSKAKSPPLSGGLFHICFFYLILVKGIDNHCLVVV
uniref:Uncharacterized protein n=1 Tax=Myoviridae sp. ctdxI18 TaxID=2826673 RepID=A0A8S5M3N5_9CAUD|nr:MAG TPA: hypothetical protein [Myoviridae sp. ctdxI18]